MSWPPAQSAAFITSGYTTIRWGTDGILANLNTSGTPGNPSNSGQILGSGSQGGGVTVSNYGGFYIVESIRGNDEIENIYIEQGTGLKATRIQLVQGRKYVMTVVDDTNILPPFANSKVYIVDPLGSGGTIHFLQCSVVENSENLARKVEGKREITVEYLTCIEGAGTVPAPIGSDTA